MKCVAIRGRVLIIGSVSSYQGDRGNVISHDVVSTTSLLTKSVSVIGFLMMQWMQNSEKAWRDIIEWVQDGTLKVGVDMQDFQGLEDIARGVDHLFSGKNIGKVVVPAKL